MNLAVWFAGVMIQIRNRSSRNYLCFVHFLLFLGRAGRLEVATCSNQDPLQATTGLVPLMGIDVWEHAYYVDYRNVRPDYVKAIWDVINWDVVGQRLAAAK